LREQEDAFGRALLDELERGDARIVVERDDGYVETETMAWYFGAPRQWHSSERQALRHVHGRVLDIGAGAGRAALELQKRGHEVVAIDISPLAIEVCRKRGVQDARVLPVTKIDSSLGTFDTVALFGNNFGLFADARRARWMLRRLRPMTSPEARIIAVSYDPYRTKNPADLTYFERNRRRGRLGGQIRLRVRYKAYATPWVDYLMVSLEEMREIVSGTGWEIDEVFSDENFFVGVITRT
jgi:SAM-dependent methyltransferase